MMELADMRDLGRVTLVKDFQGVKINKKQLGLSIGSYMRAWWNW